jgi:hypothetical protein
VIWSGKPVVPTLRLRQSGTRFARTSYPGLTPWALAQVAWTRDLRYLRFAQDTEQSETKKMACSRKVKGGMHRSSRRFAPQDDKSELFLACSPDNAYATSFFSSAGSQGIAFVAQTEDE